MKKLVSCMLVIVLLCCAFTIAASAESATVELLNTMTDFGAPIDSGSIIDYTAETDPNGHIGKKEDSYFAKSDFTVGGAFGTIEGFKTSANAEARYDYISGAYDLYPSLADNMFLRGEYLIRFAVDVSSVNMTAAVKAFEKALPDAAETISMTVTPIMPDDTLQTFLEDAGLEVEVKDVRTESNSLVWMTDESLEFWLLNYNNKEYSIFADCGKEKLCEILDDFLAEYTMHAVMYYDSLSATKAVASYMPIGFDDSIADTNYTDANEFIACLKGMFAPAPSEDTNSKEIAYTTTKPVDMLSFCELYTHRLTEYYHTAESVFDPSPESVFVAGGGHGYAITSAGRLTYSPDTLEISQAKFDLYEDPDKNSSNLNNVYRCAAAIAALEFPYYEDFSHDTMAKVDSTMPATLMHKSMDILLDMSALMSDASIVADLQNGNTVPVYEGNYTYNFVMETHDINGESVTTIYLIADAY